MMGTINRLVGMAKQAIDQNSSSQGRSSGSGRSSDWRSMVRSAADTITGEGDQHRHDAQRADAAPRPQPRQGAQGSGLSDTDRRAISRYVYLVRTAEPDHSVPARSARSPAARSSAADGIGNSVSDAGDRASGHGDQISDLGLGDLFGR